MGIFGLLRDADDICAALQSLGISARMAERGRPEAAIVSRRGSVGLIDVSLGLIDVYEGPIMCVEMMRGAFPLSPALTVTPRSRAGWDASTLI